MFKRTGRYVLDYPIPGALVREIYEIIDVSIFGFHLFYYELPVCFQEYDNPPVWCWSHKPMSWKEWFRLVELTKKED